MGKRERGKEEKKGRRGGVREGGREGEEEWGWKERKGGNGK